jgi:uncharacterized protein HemY
MAAVPAPVPDTVAELDALSRSSAETAPGIAQARKAIAAGDFLGAMATLERVLINHPEADEALLLHASLVCRVDDKTGALVELDYLRGRNIPDQSWSEATAPCAASSGNTKTGG